jgi:hypothetical protein
LTGADNEFGIPLSLSRQEAERIVDGLEELWTASMGPLRNLSRDLRALKRFFDPVATGARIRRELETLPPAPASARLLGPPLALPVQTGKLLVTPEGRISLGLLRDVLVADDDPVTLEPSAIADGHVQLVELYRSWCLHRLNQTMSLLTGHAEPLRIPSIGFLVVLLVNQSIGPERALPGKDELDKIRVVEEAVLESAAAFARTLDVSQRGLRPDRESLYRGWWAGEARRRLSGALEIKNGIHIRKDGGEEVLNLVARELARRAIDRAAVAAAFDALVYELRQREPELAQFGLAFEHPPDTRRLREHLLSAFDRELAKRGDDGVTGAA